MNDEQLVRLELSPKAEISWDINTPTIIKNKKMNEGHKPIRKIVTNKKILQELLDYVFLQQP